METRMEKIAAGHVTEHRLACMEPGGGLHEVNRKLDNMGRWMWMVRGGLVLIVAMIPLLAVWLHFRLATIQDGQQRASAVRGELLRQIEQDRKAAGLGPSGSLESAREKALAAAVLP